MALIKCPECGKDVSDKASACIHCGYPILQEIEPSTKHTALSNEVGTQHEPTPDEYHVFQETLEQSPVTKKRKQLKTWQKVLISIVSVVVIIFLIMIMIGSHNEESLDGKQYSWPSKGLATLLPIPESSIGEIQWDASYGFNIYVGETSNEAFNAYVDECSNNGFDVDYQRGNDYYYAYNSSGNRLEIHYESGMMKIHIHEAEQLDDEVYIDNSDDFITAEIEYGFIDYTEFSEYWFDGIFRCGTDFGAGDYYILPLFGAGALYEVADTPNDFSWTYYRLLRKVSVQEGEYVNVAHGAIMVPAAEVDINDWTKYGVFLVGKDISAGEYKMETINDKYQSDLYGITGIDGAYQLNDGNVESAPIDSNYLFDSQQYITLENGQYLILTNIRLTNVNQPIEDNNASICPLEIVAQKSTGTEYGYSHAEFTVKNVSGQNINTLTLNIKILDENQTVLSTTHPQEGVLLADGESIIIEALTEEGAYSMQLDGYSYYVGDNLDGEYVQGYFIDTEPVVLCTDIDDGNNTDTAEGSNHLEDSNGSEEIFILNGCFTYTPRSFMERLDDADKELDGYNYTYMRANGEENLYYELADIEGGYDYVHSVGMTAFYDADGNELSIDDDYTENIIGSITILVEDVDDVPAILVCAMCAADPSLDIVTAYNVSENIINNAGTGNEYTFNGVSYSILLDDEYYFIIISTDCDSNSVLSSTPLSPADCYISIDENGEKFEKYDNNVWAYIKDKFGVHGFCSLWDDDSNDNAGGFGGVKTYRDIVLGVSTESEVVTAYGVPNLEVSFDINTDIIYSSLRSLGEASHKYLEDTEKVLVYNYQNLFQIVFYIDTNGIMDFILYTDGIWYE